VEKEKQRYAQKKEAQPTEKQKKVNPRRIGKIRKTGTETNEKSYASNNKSCKGNII